MQRKRYRSIALAVVGPQRVKLLGLCIIVLSRVLTYVDCVRQTDDNRNMAGQLTRFASFIEASQSGYSRSALTLHLVSYEKILDILSDIQNGSYTDILVSQRCTITLETA